MTAGRSSPSPGGARLSEGRHAEGRDAGGSAAVGWSLTRRQTDAAQGMTLPPFPSFHSPPQPPRRKGDTEGVAAAITGPATLGHWDSQRCGSWTTFYATILERRTAATLVFLRSPFLWAAAASVVHLPGDRSGGATPGEQ